MINRFLTLTLSIVVLCGTNGLVFAQNPLRNKRETTLTKNPPQPARLNGTTSPIERPTKPHDATPEVYAAIYNLPVSAVDPSQARRSVTTPPLPADDQTSKTIVDHNVNQVVHLAKPKNDLAPIIKLLDSLPNGVPADNLRSAQQPIDPSLPAPDRATNPLNISQSATSLRSPASEQESADDVPPTQLLATSKQFDQEKFRALVSQLAISTGIVMCFGIAFILVAKQYMKAKSPGQKKKTQAPIQIQSTLKLSPKSNLHLIEAGEHRLIVASDQNGIKSMVRLTDSFANTLGSLEDIVDEFTEESSVSNRHHDAGKAETYSLATLALGQSQADRKPAFRTGEHNLDDDQTILTPKETKIHSARFGSNDDDKIRRQMEAALSEQGLKELILETLQKNK